METAGTNKAIRTAIRKIAGLYGIDILDVMYGTVKAGSVDLKARTCTVIPITGKSDTEIEGVNLQADTSDGELKAPVDGSTVVVGISNSLDAFIFLFSDIDTISWKGGNFNGLVKVTELTKKLNNMEKLLNSLITKFDAHTHVTTCGAGAGTAAPTPNQETGSIAPITKQSDLENTKIKHGDK